MDSRAKGLVAVSCGVVIAILAVHIGQPVSYALWGGMLALGIWALIFPAAGLLAALPMVYMIQPAPVTLGWQEVGFAALLGVGGLSAIVRERSMFLFTLKKFRVLAIIASLLLILNFATAYWHGVSFGDWLRGLAPFVFILYGIPVWLLLRTAPQMASVWKIAALGTAGLYSWQVVLVFVRERLWEASSYINDGGNWVRASANQAESLGVDLVWLKFRVTQLLPQSTDVLLPLGLVWGVLGGLQARHIFVKSLCLALVAISTAAIALTYTRSMLLVGSIVVVSLLITALYRRQFGMVVLIGLVFMFTLTGTIQFFGLQEIFLGRFGSMVQQFTAVVDNKNKPFNAIEKVSNDNRSENSTKEDIPQKNIDANITSRIDEYRIAWEMFSESLLLGQGLGVRHLIRYETNPGQKIEVFVGYVHNWVMYMLMTGGGLGLIAYCVVLFGPALIALKRFTGYETILATVAVLSLYSLFFVVFRLIPFNLVLGALWSLALSRGYEIQKG